MKKWFFPLVISFCLISCSSKVQYYERTMDEEYYYRLLAFMTDTGAQILSEKSENSLYSPIALYDQLSILLSFCDEDADLSWKLQDLLGDDMDTISSQWKAYHHDITKGLDHYSLSNNVFYQEGKNWNQERLEEQKNRFQYNLYDFDFSQGSERFAAFIEQKTEGFLSVSKNDIPSIEEYQFALIHTSYYQSAWLHDSLKTFSHPFHSEYKNTKEGTFIEKKEKVRYGNDSQMESVLFDCQDGSSLLLLRPYSSQNEENQIPLNTILTDSGRLMRFIKHMQEDQSQDSQVMRVVFPRWRGQSHLSFSSLFQEFFGEENLFENPEQTFTSLILDPSDLNIMPLQQWTKWEIEEKEMIIAHGPYLEKQQEKEIIFDSPFLYVLLSNTGIPLYMGTVRSV